MTGLESSCNEPSSNGRRPARTIPNRCLLVIEPEELVRWSLVTYLGRWFVAFSADSPAVADQILDEQPIDAVVISDDLSNEAGEEIEARARSRNPDVQIIWTLTHPGRSRHYRRGTDAVEKPFELSHLARLLGAKKRLSR